MINAILEHSRIELQRRLDLAKGMLFSKKYPEEVLPCYNWVIQSLDDISHELSQLKQLLSLGLDDKVLEQTWYHELTVVGNKLEFIDGYYIHPLYRLSDNDVLALRVIQRLHVLHPQTILKPFILSNGNFSIAPSKHSPTLYWLPVTSQHSLLHFPLFFHEFGHQLFMMHKDEMEDLIKYFQNKVAEMIKPIISQSDDKYQVYVDRAADIVETWREWAEELFCDAVGLTIGGKSYLHAFSTFIRMGGVKEFFVPEKYLSKRSHPVSLLRIRLMAERAQDIGLYAEGEALLKEWQTIAETLDVPEDYFGYYEDRFAKELRHLIDDMLTEANPVKFDQLEQDPPYHFFSLISEAWEVFLKNPQDYQNWEASKLRNL